MSKDVLQEHWQISDDAVSNPVAGETVILHLGNGTYYGLDEIGSLLWEGIKAGQTPAEICKSVAQKYEVELGTVENDMRTFVTDLVENELLLSA